MNKTELVEQTRNAFEYLQKLYLEVSYLIKELEGQLSEEEEHFMIGRPSGYAITARSSAGLESYNVNLWPLRKFSVFFVPAETTELERGQTNTKFETKPKILYFRVVLDEKDLTYPTIYFGVLYNFTKISDAKKWPEKIEHLIGSFEYNEANVFTKINPLVYENAYYKMEGKLFAVNLFDINSSEDIQDKLVKKSLDVYRKLGSS